MSTRRSVLFGRRILITASWLGFKISWKSTIKKVVSLRTSVTGCATSRGTTSASCPISLSRSYA